MASVAATEQPRPGRRRLGTMQDVADTLAIPVASAYDLARADRLPGLVRVGRLVRVDLDALDRWIEAGGQSLPGGWRQEPDER